MQYVKDNSVICLFMVAVWNDQIVVIQRYYRFTNCSINNFTWRKVDSEIFAVRKTEFLFVLHHRESQSSDLEVRYCTFLCIPLPLLSLLSYLVCRCPTQCLFSCSSVIDYLCMGQYLVYAYCMYSLEVLTPLVDKNWQLRHHPALQSQKLKVDKVVLVGPDILVDFTLC